MENPDLINKIIINNIKIVNEVKIYDGKRNRLYFNCICVCGNEFIARSDHIRREKCKSCGCLSIELSAKGHTLPNNQAAINVLYKNYKSNAEKRLLPFNLKKCDFEKIIFQNCYYCGIFPQIKVFKPSQNKTHVLAYNGIDRINSKLGYFTDNCVPCCPQCNYAKSDLTIEEFKEWIIQLINFNKIGGFI
jgi:hypothetical protein